MRERAALGPITTPVRRAVGPVLAILIAALFAARAQAGWIESKPTGETVIHVSVVSLRDPSATDAYSRSEVLGAQAFVRRFPEIFAERYRARYEADPKRYGKLNWDKVSVQLHSHRGLSIEGVETDTMAIAAGIPPDVLYLNFRKSDHYIQNGFVYPLDKPEDRYLTSMTPEELDFRVHPRIWPIMRRLGPGDANNEQVWAMPQGGALGMVLLYRKSLFDAKGLPYPTAEWTWADMLAAARKLSDPANGVYGLVGGAGPDESWYWFNYLWATRGDVMVQDKTTGQWRCVFDSRDAAMSLDFYTRLNTEPWTDSNGIARRGYTLRSGESRTAFRRGEVAMCIDYVDGSLLTSVNPELTGMVPTPIGPTGQRGSELNSKMIALSSQIKSDVVRDAAWEFIRFYDSEEACRIKTKVLVDGGLGPFVNPTYLRRFGYGEIERLTPPGWAKAFETAISTGRPEPYGPNASYVYPITTVPLREVEELALNNLLPTDEGQRLDVIQRVLAKAVARADEEMLGHIPPEKRATRDRTAWVVLTLFAAAGLWLAVRTIHSFFRAAPDTSDGRRSRSAYAWAYVLIVPAVATIVLWQYIPLMRGSLMAFQDYNPLGNSRWVGVRHFGDLLFNEYWWQSLWNAWRYSLLVIGLTFLPPILLAILLQEVPFGSLLFRLVYYLPAVLSSLVTIVLWKRFYDPTENGVLNVIVMHVPAIAYVLGGAACLWLCVSFARRLWLQDSIVASLAFAVAGVGLFILFVEWAQPILVPPDGSWAGAASNLFSVPSQPYRWLSDPSLAMLACVIPMVWAGVGPGCLIYLAALKGVSEEYYEAAEIDGAGMIDKVLFIVFPILRPLILINFIGVFIGSWYGAESNILAMTGGAANTEVAGLHIFYKAFQALQFGPATAMAWVLAFMLIGFTAYQLRMISNLEFRSTGKAK